jgi:methionyl-tRNA synthetase
MKYLRQRHEVKLLSLGAKKEVFIMSSKFYVTTPIYYVNDAPHIGHAYTTVLADVLKRYHELLGYETFFLTGTDEHGQKVQQAAAKRGIEPQTHVDEYNVRFRNLWTKMEIQLDHFIRTTDADHKDFVREQLQKLWDKGEIYSKEYEGWYSVGEERFFGEDELVDGKDPISGKPVEWLSEKNYFFKMGQYQEQLISYIEENPDFIQPEFRKNEVLGFLRQDLNDLCISRPKNRLSWGIPLPFDEDFVTYVWFDALLNYVSAVRNRTYSDGSAIWPASYHIIGKDILTTHSVYWTTMMMALEIPLPKHILAHGWWLNAGAKMSKSSGTAINPIPYMEKFGVDVFRYFLVRDMVIGQDASFSDENFLKRNNSDLANDLGNGLNRVHKQIANHFANRIPTVNTDCIGSEEQELENIAREVIDTIKEDIPKLKLSQAVEEIFRLVRGVNRYLEQKAPWKLAKEEGKREELGTVLYTAAEAMRLALTLLEPVIPGKAAAGLAMLGCAKQGISDLDWGVLQSGSELGAGEALFPRYQNEEEEEKKAPQSKQGKQKQQKQVQQDVSDTAKLDIRIAQIVEVADHPDADRIFVLKVNDGEGVRTVCSGLKDDYQASDLQDRFVVLLANLKAAKIRGIESHGMLLAADGANEEAILLDTPENKAGLQLQFAEETPVPKAKLRTKDLDKVSLKVVGGAVMGNDMPLQTADGKGVGAGNAPENALIH